MTVLELKNILEPLVSIPADTQRLIFQGKVLENDKALADYSPRRSLAPCFTAPHNPIDGLEDGVVLHLVKRPPPGTLPQSPPHPDSRPDRQPAPARPALLFP